MELHFDEGGLVHSCCRFGFCIIDGIFGAVSDVFDVDDEHLKLLFG